MLQLLALLKFGSDIIHIRLASIISTREAADARDFNRIFIANPTITPIMNSRAIIIEFLSEYYCLTVYFGHQI